MTDDEIDRLLQALNAEGFSLPYSAHVADYLPSEFPTRSGWDEERRAEGRAALRAADDRARQENRDALRRALHGQQGGAVVKREDLDDDHLFDGFGSDLDGRQPWISLGVARDDICPVPTGQVCDEGPHDGPVEPGVEPEVPPVR